MVAITQNLFSRKQTAWISAFVGVMLFGLLFIRAPHAHAAACAAPSTDYGSATTTVSAPSNGTYRVWSRIMTGTASTDNSYSLEIDGSSCYVVGDNNAIPANTWTWVDYQNGTTSSKIDATLTSGNHTFKMIGREDGVKLDRVIITTDTSCVPSGTGDNCANPADTTNPTASITSPTGGNVKGTVTVNATASDDSGTVSQVAFFVDNVQVGAADTSSPYGFSWNSTTATNGTHTLTVKATDSSNNVGTSSSVVVTVDNSTPTVSLTAPTNGATISGTTSLTATASDNVGVTTVEFYRGSTLMSSDSSSPYSYSWNTTGVANGSYTLTAKAYDAAGNVTTSSGAAITVNNIAAPPPDTTPQTTSITSPTAGATLTGTNSITASASDGVGVSKVELYIDGSLIATDIASPYSFSWNTTTYSNASHSLVTKAYDAANNIGTSSTVNVTVNNAVATPVAGDVNGDTHVTIVDLSVLLSHYSASGNRSAGDMNNDGVVNIIDLSILLTNYGR